MAPTPQRVLVTGSAGAIGQPVCEALAERGHSVRGFDRAPAPSLGKVLQDTITAELTDRPAIDRAMIDIQTVIHLAAVPSDEPFMEQLLDANVVGLFHIMDAARQAGVQRVILASSCHAIGGLKREAGKPLPADRRTAPKNHYGLTKAWAEQMGEMYARCYGMSVIAVRIGWLPRAPMNPDKTPEHSVIHDLYLSPQDAGRFFVGAVETPDIDFAILYAMGPGRPDDPRYDLESARRLIGFEPRDRWPSNFPRIDRSL